MEADINLAILEEEHLIGRLKTIELLERQSPYRGSPERVDQRFAHALAAVPTELQTAALATFASVRYLGQPVLADAWRFLWSSLDLVGRGIADLNEVVFLELDRDQIRDDFFRANSLAGRLQDNYPWRSGHDIVDTLAPLTDGALLGPLRDAMVEYLGRRLWVLLVDVREALHSQ